MLKSIKLNNYTTFIKPTEIDFSATNYKFLENENVGSNRVLKGALFVGENASGKTQILKAIRLLLSLLFKDNFTDFFGYKSFYTTKKTFSIEYNFVIDNTDISYYIELGSKNIVSEKLCVNNEIVIERNKNRATTYLEKEKKNYEIGDELLFLRRFYFDTNFYEDKILNKWFDFLGNSIYINCFDSEIRVSKNLSEIDISSFLEKNGVKPINDFFKKINYSQNIIYDNATKNKKGFLNFQATDKFVSFKKRNTDVYIPISYESTGNITLINILPSFLHTISNNSMLIIDEFSSGLHNELEECLIKYFNHFSNDSQLFMVSHSTNIINNTILRPDQIYSVSFDSKTGSLINRFSNEMPREAQNTEKMYLNGVFDGLPHYNKFFKD